MGDLSDAVAATDGPWALAAIAVIGLYVLLWRYAGQILTLLHENRENAEKAVEVAASVQQDVQDITTAIATNHGSKSLGDAVDRLSTWMLTHLEESRQDAAALAVLRNEFIQHLLDVGADKQHIQTTLTEIDERLSEIEAKQKKGA